MGWDKPIFWVVEGIPPVPPPTRGNPDISVTAWFLKLMYCLNSEFLIWREIKIIFGEHIHRGKDGVFKIIKNSTGIICDALCNGQARGG